MAEQDEETFKRRDFSSVMPDDVSKFLENFKRAIDNADVDEILQCYNVTFKKLTDRHYKESSWPDPDYVVELVNEDDGPFILLYRELYFRHIYIKLEPTIEHRFESYKSYIDLVDHLIGAKEPVSLELPHKWLWEIIDEFIYQYQDFTVFRAKVASRTESEKQQLQDHPEIWNVNIVLNVLHSLIVKSNINAQLQAYQEGRNPQDVAGEFGAHQLYTMLGYFSLIGLLRVQCLLAMLVIGLFKMKSVEETFARVLSVSHAVFFAPGDYRQALQVVANVELEKKGLYSRVPACQITVYHYVGFCYLMLRRYQDAIRNFESILYYIKMTHSYGSRSSSTDFIGRRKENILSLLALTYALCPQRLDDSIEKEMLERHRDDIFKIQNGDEEVLAGLFSRGCPRFLSPVSVNYEGAEDHDLVQEAFQYQVQLFKDEIRQQAFLTQIRSYLQLYTSMPMSKLASFLSIDESELRMKLHSYKHKTAQLTWKEGQPLSGTRECADSLDFYIDGDLIHIANVKVERCYGEDFLRDSLKMIAKKA